MYKKGRLSKIVAGLSEALQARDLSKNFMAEDDGSKVSGVGQGAGQGAACSKEEEKPEPPRPKGAPNRSFSSCNWLL